MSRSTFFTRKRDGSPLLPQHHDSVSLSNLSPRSQAVSPSPPPSFYRDNNARTFSPSPANSHSPRPTLRSIQFAPPPPPVTSLYLPAATHTQRPTSSSSSHNARPSQSILHVRRGSNSLADPLLVLSRRERSIQKELQALLNAQSAGLVQGFGGSNDTASDAGSSTPTMSQSQRSSSLGREIGNGGRSGVVPVRQPKKKPLGLRGARRALGRDMGELIAIKSEELGVLEEEIARREGVLQRVAAWERSIESTRRKLAGSAEGGEDREIQELKNEEQAVTKEIQELEDRLAQMRARKKWLGERVREEDNKREARLSSYRGALRDVEMEVERFLRHPPVEASVVMGDERGFMDLPEKRRTLRMASEWWGKELAALEVRKREVEVEQTALEEGKGMWDAGIELITQFEDGLRAQMASGEPQSQNGLKAQIDKMHSVIEKLDKSFNKAEDNGWNLLICAVGAELEAFKEGEEILKSALEVISRQESFVSRKDAGEDAELEKEDSFHSTDSGLNTLAELNGALMAKGEGAREGGGEEESEDDGPDLASLLVDRGHFERRSRDEED